MKDYKNLMKIIEKDDEFTITKTPKRNTVKVTHVKSGRLYSVHPSDNAVQPLKNWLKKIKENKENI